MRKNKKRKAFLHAAIRTNSLSRKSDTKRRLILIWGGIFATILIAALTIGTLKLREFWIEQCVVTDLAKQVTVTTGEFVPAETILEVLGIRKGCNLAKIDFRERYTHMRKKVSNIRDLTLIRHLPNRLEIHVEERQPIARVIAKSKTPRTSSLVVDSDGVVFNRRKSTALLPTICEKEPLPRDGATLSGHARAALRLLEVAHDDFNALNILSVDTTANDYLVATLGTYARAKIAWKNMDEPATDESDRAMRRQLTNLQNAIRTAGTGVKVWNVTEPDRVQGDTKEPIL